MIEKIIKYKKYILGVIGILLALTMFVGVKYLMKSKYEELPEVKLRNINNKKSFAIMVQNGDGYEEYTSKDNTWPGEEYKFKEAKCTDNNGALVDNAVTFADGKVSLKTNKTIYCTLYFDEKVALNLRNLCEKYSNLKECMDVEKNNTGDVVDLSPMIQGDMYRYQVNPADAEEAAKMRNWICFGTNDASTCKTASGIDKYMYRIIGITEEGQMYLIKETLLREGTTRTFKWNTKNLLSECLVDGKDICEWPQVDLYKRLNGAESNGNPIFVNNTQYEYLKSGDENGTNDGIGSEWYQLIADHNWMYGDTNDTSSNIYNGDAMYGIETGGAATTRWWPDEEQGQKTCDVNHLCIEQEFTWSKSVNAKIGLMYMHDLVYAYYDGSTEDSRGNPGSYKNTVNSWIHFRKDGYAVSSYEWLITRFGVYGLGWDFIAGRPLYGESSMNGYNMSNPCQVRPVFYLESKAKIASGDGTKENPFILEI